MQSFLRAARDTFGLLALLIFGYKLLPIEWRLMTSPELTGSPLPFTWIIWESFMVEGYLLVVVALLPSLWILHHVRQRGSLRWYVVTLVASVWVFIFPVLAYVSVYISDKRSPLQGEAGMAYLLAPVYSLLYAGPLIPLIVVVALLIRYVPSWWKWMYSVLGLLIAAWIVLLASHGFCSRTDGACSARKMVRRGLDAASCTTLPDFQGCLTQYAIATNNPNVCYAVAQEYSRRCVLHERGSCAADGVNALNAVNSCRIRFAVTLNDPSVCAGAPLENNNRYTCCSFAYHVEGKHSGGPTEEQKKHCGISPGSEIETSRSSSSSSSSPITSWMLFTNTKYHYSLRHPPDCYPGSNDYGGIDPSESMSIVLCGLSIEPQDPTTYQTPYPDMQLPLEEFAEKIWRMNAEDKNPSVQGKRVGPLLQVTLANHAAYTFTLDVSYTDYRGGMLLEKENTVVIFSDGKMNFISLYESADERAKSILNSLTFER